jgi:5-formyltetrahydrofolate cyclo-ligase
MTKNKIRKSLKQELSLMSKSEVLEKSSTIQKNLLNYLSDYKGGNSLLYKQANNEVSLDKVESYLIDLNENIFLPKVMPGNNLVFNKLDNDTALVSNKYNILESTSEELINPLDLNFIILPVLGIDHKGFRLGHGGGYYDRGLQTIPKNIKKPLIIGLGYDFQYVEKSFGESHDIRVDLMITEKNIINF